MEKINDASDKVTSHVSEIYTSHQTRPKHSVVLPYTTVKLTYIRFNVYKTRTYRNYEFGG